jgi:hypothetical protein
MLCVCERNACHVAVCNRLACVCVCVRVCVYMMVLISRYWRAASQRCVINFNSFRFHKFNIDLSPPQSSEVQRPHKRPLPRQRAAGISDAFGLRGNLDTIRDMPFDIYPVLVGARRDGGNNLADLPLDTSVYSDSLAAVAVAEAVAVAGVGVGAGAEGCVIQ